MSSMLESMRASWASPGTGGNEGLLGPLAGGRDGGGQGAFHGLPADYGFEHRQFGGPRASLMESGLLHIGGGHAVSFSRNG